MDTSKLSPDTKKIWEQLHDLPDLSGFVLVGGTALTLHISHRVSEDLDFAYPAVKLPQAQIENLLRTLAARGVRFELNQDPLNVADSLNAGLNLGDYQQDFMAEGSVKVTFFAPEADMIKLLGGMPVTGLRVATMQEIFESKVLVCAVRSKTRDWFDLYILMTQYGYRMEDIYRVFDKLDAIPKFSIAETRLCSGRPEAGDEGYETLWKNPPSLATMTAYFVEQFDRFEIEMSKQRFVHHAVTKAPATKGGRPKTS